MSEHGKNCMTSECVGCDVGSCVYNSDGGRCHADHIQVKNSSANCESDTFCGTYQQRNQTTF